MSATWIRIRGGAPLRGAITLPPDRAVAQIALVLAALGEGESRIEAAQSSRAFAPLLRALHALGVEIAQGEAELRVVGRGLRGLSMPAAAIDCGRSRSTFALLAGALCAQQFGTRLLLDARDCGALDHLIGALRARGANIAGSARAGEPPAIESTAPALRGGASIESSAPALRGGASIAPLLSDEHLAGLQCTLESPDADTKSAILLSGLFAAGPTGVSEPLLSADHTERMLLALGVPVRRLGSIVGFDPAQWDGRLAALGAVALPSDTTLCAFVAAAASVIAGSHVALHAAGMNPTRSGFFDALRLLGGQLLVIAKGDRAGREPIAEVQVRGGAGSLAPALRGGAGSLAPALRGGAGSLAPALRGGAMGGEIVLRCGDSLPALCLLGARSARGLQLHDGEPFAAAGSTAWTQLAAVVRSFGAESTVEGAGLQVAPAPRLTGARVDALEDHRLALTAVIFGLAAEGETEVQNAACIAEDRPELLRALQALGAHVEWDDARVTA